MIKKGFIHITIVLTVIQLSNAHRRIKDGKEVEVDKRYVVYLVKAEKSSQAYTAWLCGGALVSQWFIVTSAACVEDVQHMYAIAGYKKYVPAENLETDPCTKEMKKRIVLTCVPKAYELDYEKIEKWSYIDIAVAKVDKKYDFNDERYNSLCSYAPVTIPINYDPKYQEPGTDTMVLGWGHKETWRQVDDTSDYNQGELQYAATLIQHKEVCKEAYSAYPNFAEIIDKYMICGYGKGNIDAAGDVIVKAKPLANGCVASNDRIKLKGASNDIECQEIEFGKVGTESNERDKTKRSFARNTTSHIFRRQGICQNDHGGPLVTWMGAHEILIGVASVFRVANDSICEGPYMYTSTQCNGAFLDCVVNGSDGRRNAICDKPPAGRGFHIIERTVHWKDQMKSSAGNENIKMRPQVPLHDYFRIHKNT